MAPLQSISKSPVLWTIVAMAIFYLYLSVDLMRYERVWAPAMFALALIGWLVTYLQGANEESASTK
jgi:hypothetical protein